MLTKNAIKITDIEEVNSRVLQFQFNVEWTMDNTAVIIDYLVQMIAAKVMETIQGADLHCVRIHYGVSEFLLNFEEYSHSCWLECATEQDILGLSEIKLILS
ncbi:DUF3630 family protein [Colwellia sp. M166]|jgi:hypothetical protein|uniref:DUF3630 family protein n=1 Tax=Colwellia sp. M166 TaxID=2583805 RepID=UPI00211DFB33|nr:DUF3630 family protein [Colwellia sp. M166]UUO23655.1 DUF3630 family protein [Colwellia sp. M166]|tara:strand:- start:66493 stop:66798 length:306 start_codon:yes stop_codon:yes gene_type:complete